MTKEKLLALFAFQEFVMLAAAGPRSDGTYNYCREALEMKAKELLEKHTLYEVPVFEESKVKK